MLAQCSRDVHHRIEKTEVYASACVCVSRSPYVFCTHMCANIHRFATRSLHSFAFCTHTNEHWTTDEDEDEKKWNDRTKKSCCRLFFGVFPLLPYSPAATSYPMYSNILKKTNTQNSICLSLTNSFAIDNTPNAKHYIRKVKLRQVHVVGLLHKIYFNSFSFVREILTLEPTNERREKTTIVSEKKNKCDGNNDVAVVRYIATDFKFRCGMSVHRAHETNRKKNKKK